MHGHKIEKALPQLIMVIYVTFITQENIYYICMFSVNKEFLLESGFITFYDIFCHIYIVNVTVYN